MGRYGMRAVIIFFVVFGGVLVAVRAQSLAQTPNDECLVEVQDQNGSLADGATLTQVAIARKCTFSLRLCTNVVQPGCEPAAFQNKKFRASGHCGPVGKLQVTASGTGSVCGNPTAVTVRTRKNGKGEGQCTIRAEVRSARMRARTDVDHITLACQP